MKKNRLLNKMIYSAIGFITGIVGYIVAVNHVEIVNINLTQKIKVIDWPEEFSPSLNQTGEINSPMTFRIEGDTLKIEFDQQ